MCIPLGFTALFALIYLGALFAHLPALGPLGGALGWLSFIYQPASLALVSLLLVFAHRHIRKQLSRPVAEVGAAFFLAGLCIVGSEFLTGLHFYVLLTASIVAGMLAIFTRKDHVIGARGFALLGAAGAVGTLAFLALVPIDYFHLNEFGLISFASNSRDSMDYSGMPSKDNYPRCQFDYNSLGYRDIEPPSGPQERIGVLLIGDSFIWGDGIPDNAQTLPARLRQALDRLAPGRIQVSSAGFPGNGLYGYSQALIRLAPKLKPDIVVVGYLHDADHDALDSQFLVDRLPTCLALRRILTNLRINRHIHRQAAQRRDALRSVKQDEGFFDRAIQNIAEVAQNERFKVILLNYFPGDELHENLHNTLTSLEIFDLPAELRFEGKSTPLWYAKDCHPKPELNRILAEALAKFLLQADLLEKTGKAVRPAGMME